MAGAYVGLNEIEKEAFLNAVSQLERSGINYYALTPNEQRKILYYNNIVPPEGSEFKFSVTGHSPRVRLTAEAIQDAMTNDAFAGDMLYEARKSNDRSWEPSSRDINTLRQRLAKTFPQVIEGRQPNIMENIEQNVRRNLQPRENILIEPEEKEEVNTGKKKEPDFSFLLRNNPHQEKENLSVRSMNPIKREAENLMDLSQYGAKPMSIQGGIEKNIIQPSQIAKDKLKSIEEQIKKKNIPLNQQEDNLKNEISALEADAKKVSDYMTKMRPYNNREKRLSYMRGTESVELFNQIAPSLRNIPNMPRTGQFSGVMNAIDQHLKLTKKSLTDIQEKKVQNQLPLQAAIDEQKREEEVNKKLLEQKKYNPNVIHQKNREELSHEELLNNLNHIEMLEHELARNTGRSYLTEKELKHRKEDLRLYDADIATYKSLKDSSIENVKFEVSRIKNELLEKQWDKKVDPEFKDYNDINQLRQVGSHYQKELEGIQLAKDSMAKTEEELKNRHAIFANYDPKKKILGSVLEIIAKPRNIENIYAGAGSMRAPLQIEHEEAEDLVRRDIEDDAQNEFNKDEYVNRYVQDYKTNYIDPLAEEQEEQWREQIEPLIRSRFKGQSGFYSGVKEKTMLKARQDFQKALRSEQNKMLFEAKKDAMSQALNHVSQKMQERLQKHQIISAQASSLGNIGTAKQAQLQAEKNLHRAQFDEANSESLRRNQDILNLANNMPVSGTHMEMIRPAMNFIPQNPSPNYAQGVMGALGGGMNAMMQQKQSDRFMTLLENQQRSSNLANSSGGVHTPFGYLPNSLAKHAAGGPVRAKYANGGHVANAMAQWKELNKYASQLEPEEVEANQHNMHYANAYLGAHEFSPAMNYISHTMMGMGANPNIAEGIHQGQQAGLASNEAKMGQLYSAYEKKQNLMDKINHTRMVQQQFLAGFLGQQQTHEETKMHHEAVLGETKRHHGAVEDYNKKKLAAKLGEGTSNNPETGQPFVSKYEEQAYFKNKYANPEGKVSAKKEVNEALLGIRKSLSAKKQTEHLNKLLVKANTGPWIGAIKSHLPATKTDNRIRVAADNIIMDLHQGMKNIPRSEEFIKRLEATKPTIKNSAEANQDSLSLMNAKADDAYEHNVSVLMSHGWTMEQIEDAIGAKGKKHIQVQAKRTAIPEKTPVESGNPAAAMSTEELKRIAMG